MADVAPDLEKPMKKGSWEAGKLSFGGAMMPWFKDVGKRRTAFFVPTSLAGLSQRAKI